MFHCASVTEGKQEHTYVCTVEVKVFLFVFLFVCLFVCLFFLSSDSCHGNNANLHVGEFKLTDQLLFVSAYNFGSGIFYSFVLSSFSQ